MESQDLAYMSMFDQIEIPFALLTELESYLKCSPESRVVLAYIAKHLTLYKQKNIVPVLVNQVQMCCTKC